MTPPTTNFNAHHSPVGAYLSFTCGHHGTPGGLAAHLGKPANQEIYIGYKNADRYSRAPLQVLPFFNGADKIDPLTAFTLEQSRRNDPERFSPFTDQNLSRSYRWSTDRWNTTDKTLEFSIYTPFIDLPDPATASAADMRNALLPAITAELIIDNRTGTTTKTGFFAINFHDPGNRLLTLGNSAFRIPHSAFPPRLALAHRLHYAFAAELLDMPEKGCPAHPRTESPAPFPFLRWWPHEGLEDPSNPVHLLGTTPGIGFEVPPGKRYTLHVALACHFPEIVTTRLEGRYLYTRHYKNLEDVLTSALDRFCDLKQLAKSQDQQLANSGLSENQQFLIAHSTRSYYANTQLLEIENAPYWIVNEGEYCMMNTLDLSVDQVFWELERNPWVVKNLLDNFLKHYSYTDQVKIKTTEDTENTETTKEKSEQTSTVVSVPSVSSVVNPAYSLAPGGLSFTHDQGTHNQFSPFSQSSYELKNLTGCFSYMTQEQLCNWILIAASYLVKTKDNDWAQHNLDTFNQCLRSIKNRAPEGLLAHDSDKCGTGSEITTYDSLDVSLGQARNNLYLGVKTWAACWGLYTLLGHGDPEKTANDRASGPDVFGLIEDISENLSQKTKADFLPAVFEPQSPGFASSILSAIEGFVYPLHWQNITVGRNFWEEDVLDRNTNLNEFITHLATHTAKLLSDPDHRNKFPDHGIKLSSTSNNSWLSKITIVQHVARSLFNLDENGRERTPQDSGLKTQDLIASGWEKSDAAHVTWLTTGPGAYWCACDQIVNGEAKGSKYYPRLITTALWLRETSSKLTPNP